MAEPNFSNVGSRQSLTTIAQDVQQELRIAVAVGFDLWTGFEGTRAQLEAEQLIPDDFEWPPGKESRCWQANGLDYWLRRHRPAGMRGPASSWANVDHWHLSCSPSRYDSGRRAVDLKRKALEDELYRQSPAGRRAKDAEWEGYRKAKDDETFQRFRSLIVQESAKRGRKPQATQQA